jgi:hypothetical protein
MILFCLEVAFFDVIISPQVKSRVGTLANQTSKSPTPPPPSVGWNWSRIALCFLPLSPLRSFEKAPRLSFRIRGGIDRRCRSTLASCGCPSSKLILKEKIDAENFFKSQSSFGCCSNLTTSLFAPVAPCLLRQQLTNQSSYYLQWQWLELTLEREYDWSGPVSWCQGCVLFPECKNQFCLVAKKLRRSRESCLLEITEDISLKMWVTSHESPLAQSWMSSSNKCWPMFLRQTWWREQENISCLVGWLVGWLSTEMILQWRCRQVKWLIDD